MIDLDYAMKFLPEEQAIMLVNDKDEDRARKILRTIELSKKHKIPTSLQCYGVNCGQEEHKGLSRSVNRNWWNRMLGLTMGFNLSDTTFAAGYRSMRNTAGTIFGGAYIPLPYGESSSEWPSSGYALLSCAINSSVQGIMVGSGSTAESTEGYVLATAIVSGNSAGQLYYSPYITCTHVYDIPTKTWTVTHRRFFSNLTSASVDVNEIGVYLGLYGGGNRYFMEARDVLPATVTVPVRGILKVQYIFTNVFPE